MQPACNNLKKKKKGYSKSLTLKKKKTTLAAIKAGCKFKV